LTERRSLVEPSANQAGADGSADDANGVAATHLNGVRTTFHHSLRVCSTGSNEAPGPATARHTIRPTAPASVQRIKSYTSCDTSDRVDYRPFTYGLGILSVALIIALPLSP
jgi:hypothetical protein